MPIKIHITIETNQEAEKKLNKQTRSKQYKPQTNKTRQTKLTGIRFQDSIPDRAPKHSKRITATDTARKRIKRTH